HDTEVLTTHAAYQTPPVLLHGGSAGDPSNAHGSACYGIIFAHWPANTFYNGMITDAEQGIYINYALSTQFGGAFTRLALNTQASSQGSAAGPPSSPIARAPPRPRRSWSTPPTAIRSRRATSPASSRVGACPTSPTSTTSATSCTSSTRPTCCKTARPSSTPS